MKKKYSRFNINSFFVLLNSKNSLLIVLILFLFSLDNFAQSISSFNPINACTNSGSSVIITGTNFTGATSVTFNGVAATSFTVDNDSQITAILSASASTGFISVVTLLGTATSTGVFTVDSLPTATAGGTQTICSNATATISGAFATNGTIVWTENGAGNITAGATTLTPTYTPTAADAGTSVTLTMTVTSDNACAPQTQTATYTVIVNPLPTAIAGGTQTICSNAIATVSGASATNGTILWTENGAGTITAGATTLTPTYTPNAADAGTSVTLTMTVTSDNACAPQTEIATYTVIVNPLPTATAGGTQTICSNATATISGASATNGTIVWTENGAGNITAGATTLTPTYTPTAADAGTSVTLTMTVTSDNACAPQTETATYTVIVNPLPTATAGGTQTICSNATATVSGASATNGTILWTENGAGTITAGTTTLTPTYTPTAADAGTSVTLTMTVTSDNACAPQTQTATYTVIVNPLPTATAGGTQTICSNATATISGASATNGTILWTENGTGTITAGATTLTPTYTPTAADAGTSVTLTMTVTSNNACAPQTQTATYTVIVNPLPTATAGGTQTICSNATATISGASATNGTFLWTENGAGNITAGATTLTPTYTPTAADAGTSVTLTMTVTSNNACAPQTQTATYTVIVNPLPTVSIAVNPGNNICAGTSVTFTATPVNGGATPSYQWKVNGINVGTNISTFTSTSFMNTDKVTVVLTSSTACTSPVTSNLITMTVNDVVVPSVSISASSTTICPGNSIVFSALATNGGTTPSYQWMINSINTGTNSPSFSTSSLADGDIVTVRLTSNAICVSPITDISNSIPITVNPATPAIPGIISGTSTICPGISGLIYNISAVTDATTYTWVVPSGWSITGGMGTNSITVTSGSAGQNGTISVTAGNSCGTSVSNSLAVTVSPATPATPGAISGANTQCPALTGQTYSITAVTNASTYNWTVPTGWSITGGTGTNSITVTSGNPGQNGTISVTATNSCGTSSVRSLAVSVSPTTPATPGTITGIVTQCPALTGQTYSITAVANASTYNWTVPTGWSITGGAGTNSITVTSGTASQNGTISVTATNSCGTSTASTLAVTVSPATPVTPGVIAGTPSVCPSITGLSYSIAVVPNATTYNWSVPIGWSLTGGAGTNSITVTSGTAGQNGTISVTATNSCGTSSARTLAVTVSPATPATPGAITGTVTQCPALTGQIYSISTVANATSYNWTIPTGWSITGGAGTSSITVTSGTAGQNGTISVTATNSCGTSTASALSVTVSPATPTLPGVISGTSTVCPAIIGLTYSIALVPNATTYTWIVPTGWSITGGAGTNSITVTSGSAGQNGTISVTAGNSCGTSSARSLAVSVSPAAPAAPGVISGAAEQCISRTGLTYSISAVTNATSYTWTLPLGWSITAGINTSSITVSTSGTAVGGNITVTANNSCGTSGAQTFVVSVNTAIPTTPGLINGVTVICPTKTLTYSIAAVSNTSNYIWTVPTNWSITSGQGTTSIIVQVPNNASSGFVSVVATNVCGNSPPSALQVDVNSNGGVSAGTDITVCSGTASIILAGAISGVINNQNEWDWVVTTGTINSPNSLSSSYTLPPGFTSGSITIKIVSNQTTVDCPVVSDEMIITVLPNPTANISVTGANPICNGSTSNITFTATPNTTLTYTVSGVAGSSTINIGASGTASLTTAALTSNTIYTLTNVSYSSTPTCIQTVSGTATVTVNTAPTVNAGGTDVVCQSPSPSPITLSGATLGGGATTGAWSITSGGGLLSSTAQTATPATVTYTPTANFSGTVILTLTTNAPTACSPVSATRTITVNVTPTVNAGGPNTVCQSASPSAITLSGATVGGGATTGAWSITSGGGTLSNTLQTASPATVTYTPAANFSGTVTLTLTTNAPTACSPASTTRTITINAAPTVNAGGTEIICQSPTPNAITLSGASVGGGATTGAWSITSGGGTLSDIAQTANPATVTYTPAANFSGTVTLTLTTNALTTCSAVSTTRTVTVNAIPTVNAGGPNTVCQSGTPSAIALTGASVGGGATTGTWSITSGGGTLSNTAQTATPATVTYTPAVNFSGIVTLTLTTNAPTACSPVSTTRTITINTAPTVNAGGTEIICQSSTPSAITLTGASVGGGATTGAWSITSGGGLLSNTAPTATPETVTYTPAVNFSGAVTLTLTTNALSGCSVTSAVKTITVNAAPTVNAGGIVTVCQSPTPTAITLSGATVGGGATTAAWAITLGGGSLSSTAQTATPATITYTPAANFSGTVTLTLTTNALTACSAISATRTITVNEASIVSAGINQTICSNTTATMGGLFGGGASSATWSTNGSGTFNNNTPTAIYSPSAADISSGSVTLTYTTNDPIGPCGALNANMILTIKKAVAITNQPSNTSICASFPTSLSVVAVGDGLTYQWYKGAAPSGTALVNSTNILGAQSANLNFNQANLSDDGIYYVVISGASPCATVTSAQRTLNVDQAIIISSQPVSQSLCNGSNVTFTVVADANGDPLSYQWRKNGSNITGQTASTLTINSIVSGDAANYDVVISGPAGYTCSSVQSAIATLMVTQIPTVIISYAGNPFCENITTAQPVTRTGTNAFTGGFYSYSIVSGGPTLSLDTSTGAITPSTSNAGTYTITYTTPVTGICMPVTATTTVTITQIPTATISYTGTPFCNSTPTDQAVNLSGTNAYTGGTYSAPSGLTINATTGAISPSSSTAGTYIVTYTIPASGGCGITSVTTSVTINPLPVATFNYGSTTFCKSAANPLLTFTGGGVAGIFSSTPAGLSINSSTGAINLATSTAGTYTVVNTIAASGGCIAVTHSQSLTIHPVTIGGSITGFFSATPTVISNIITACHLGSGTLNLNSTVGNILRWEYTTNGGVTWVPIANTSTVNNFTNISQTTLYRAVIESGACGLAYSAIAIVNVIPPNIKPDPVSASPSTLCLGSSSLFTSQSSYGTGQFLQGGDFQTGQLNTQDPRGWLVDGSPGGYTASANNTSSNHWAGTNPHPFPGGIIYDSGDPKFAIANGPLTTTLQTPIFNSLGLTTFSFGFDQAYKLLTGDRILIELSLNGGASYTVTLQDITGPAQSALFNTFANDNTSFDLQNYIGQTQLRVKFTFIGANTNSAWALDNFKFPDAPPNQTIEWTDEDGNIISTINTVNITPVSPGVQVYGVTTLINGCRSSGIDGTEFVTVNVNFAYAGKDLAIVAADCGNNTVTLNAYDNRLTAAQNIAKGAWDNNYITDTAIGTGATGKWTIKSSTAISPCNTVTFLPNDTDPNATFTGDAGTYVLSWTAAGCSDDVTVVLTDCSTINFDGTNDNITFKDNYDFTAPFSIEVWVKPNSVTGTQTIFSKRDSNNLATGYDLKLTGDKISFNWNGAGTVISNNAISTNRWYHIAVTFSGTTYRLYIDGIEVKNASGSLPTTNDFDCILGAMNKSGSQPISYFNAWMDELRIWNKALTPEQLHQIMNQEIKSNGTAVTGVIIPVDVNGLSWTNDLLGYYQMSSISCGYLNPTKGTAVGKLRNITSAQEQTAPIPYTSRVNGQDWGTDTTWTHFNVWDAPNSIGVDNSTPIDWNIVQISHNINSGNKDITVLGLLSTAGKLTMADPVVTNPIENNDGQGLWITLYLLLNGNIDLVGQSQLVQKRYTATQYDDSILDEVSSGYIERDQQGQRNSYNYNYWSSPVSIQGGLNNSPYAIANILKDGTNSLSPNTIDFNDGAFYADVVSNPIKISNRWLWSYNSQTLNSNTDLNDYYQWKYVGSTGLIKTGEGHTMKGTGGIAAITALQNYVFTGKPNSGTITLSLPYDQTYLVGNPYPSALDAYKFIRDNLKDCSGCTNTDNVFNGALYFWDHFGLSNNHYLAEYEGGYATYTLMGGVAGIADSSLTGTGAGTKVPERYIPVAQGFFVDAYLDSGLTGTEIPTLVNGGTLTFRNSQRVFVKESGGNSLFMKTAGATKSSAKDSDAETETRSKIRLGFDSSLGVHRQLLLGADSSTTSMFDIGYDAPMFDLSIDDMFWEINNIEYVIQAVTDFNDNQIIPLGLTVGNEGKVKIKIDALENISNTTEIYLHDNVTGIYHDIRTSDFTISLAVGEYRDRFSLQFTNKTLDVDENNLNDGLIVLYSNNYKVLIIQNKALDSTVNEVRLFNILGQAVANWDVKNENQTKIQIPIKNLSSGVYIVKLKTSKGAYNKKIIIK
ncbi:LamG-like jellyroll fold domain-containing protein [Flavobacterium yafengii]|uniref:LamG-like jellyroll fold domain-containing protein n=1 Tax=Flavobacterium yafengii TaxID=3041253 RepID=UPI0024A7C186|nr:LamG-like jellyroll fold domain-containing protein [Flavobacterium yafengii]MDI6046470.1 T9SS type A sorting domain-containing protein [Flavobacterium yafengii]